MQFLKRSAKTGSNRAGPAATIDSDFKETSPALYEFLHVTAWEDGAARETGSLLLFVNDGLLKAMLNDRDGDRVAFVSGATWVEVMGAVEGGLQEDSLDWRTPKKFKPGKK